MMKLRKLFLIICSICFTVALALGVAACGDENDGVIRVSSVSLNKSELTLEVGGEETLSAIINPSNATDQTVEWYSDDFSIATVDENGVVKGVAVGETTITVSASRKQATCKVTVTESTAVGVSSITLNHQALVMLVGETNTNLVSTVLPANSAKVSWSSSNTDIVTVNDKGHLTAIAVGTSTITATAGGKSATCAVTVVAEKVVENVELNKDELELEEGAKETLKATVYPLGLSADLVWESSKTDIATVDNGVVTAVAVGEAEITVTAGEKSATCKVTVKAKTPTTVAVESVSLNHTTLSINMGDDETLIPTVSPSNATNKSVTWKSSNEDIATVDANGKVTASSSKAGDTLITVTTVDGGKTATCTVTVVAPIDDNSIVTYAHAGEESAAFEWKDTNAAKAKVYYKLSTASSYTQIDSELVRQKSSTHARADILGLKGGAKYDFKITSSNNTVVVAEKVDIASLDRSGYAHVGVSGVGAYNDDGTLKSNAKVIYLTESNKNNIFGDGTNTSIAEYLSNAKEITKTTPIVVRVIGTVGSATWKSLTYTKSGSKLSASQVKGLNGKQLPTSESGLTQDALISGGYNELNYYPAKLGGNVKCDPIDGLISKATWNSSKSEYDSCWNDLQVSEAKNITVEGVGEDAEIFQWGITFKKCNSIEVRNIRFWDYTEDACSFEGTEASTTADGFSYKNFWVHHNIFDIGMNYWDVCAEQDKGDGDGSTDFKKLSYVTIAYNRYNKTHKTGLVGGDDAHLQACFTFHHNYYNGCDQRMPLGRQANMHLYNNYYSSSGLYSVSLRASAYAYIENCVFTSKTKTGNNPTKPIELIKGDNGVPSAKVVDCEFEGSISNGITGKNNLYQGTRAAATDVEGDNLYGLNFEKNLPYTVTSKLATDQVAETIPNVAGTLKRLSNIKIDGSSQDDSGNTGGGDSGSTNPTTGTTYTYSYTGNKVGSWSTSASKDTNEAAPADGLKIVEGKPLTLSLSTDGTKIEISMRGFTTASGGNNEWVKVTLKASDGTVVGTLKGTTPANKELDNYTFTDGGILTASAAFTTVEISFEGQSGKNFSITEVSIFVE